MVGHGVGREHDTAVIVISTQFGEIEADLIAARAELLTHQRSGCIEIENKPARAAYAKAPPRATGAKNRELISTNDWMKRGEKPRRMTNPRAFEELGLSETYSGEDPDAERMVRAREVLLEMAADVTGHFAIEADGSFTIDTMTLEATPA